MIVDKEMAANAFKLGGYEFKFLKEPPDALVCPICTFVARDPQQMDCCGRVYCQLCLSEHKKCSDRCPQCRQSGHSFTDKKSNRDIKALKIKCENYNSGCQWEGEIGCIEEHLQICDYEPVQCTNECKKNDQVARLLRKDLKYHLLNNCPRRQFRCPHCKEQGEYEERTGAHLATCEYVWITCDNDGCNAQFTRCMNKMHKLVCDFEPVPCKYAEVGCKERPLRKDLEEHEEDAQSHLLLTARTVLTLNKQIKGLVDELKLANEHIKDIKQTKFVFKLNSYIDKKKSGADFHSNPFNSHKNGYKFCLKVVAKGKAGGKDTHVSVYASLMKGEHDDSLTWPFTGIVTVELLNQLEDKNHHKEIIKFQANMPNCQRVVDRERGLGYGSPKFILHTDLDYKSDKNCQYLKDDTLIFRMSVEVPDYKPWLECTD